MRTLHPYSAQDHSPYAEPTAARASAQTQPRTRLTNPSGSWIAASGAVPLSIVREALARRWEGRWACAWRGEVAFRGRAFRGRLLRRIGAPWLHLARLRRVLHPVGVEAANHVNKRLISGKLSIPLSQTVQQSCPAGALVSDFSVFVIISKRTCCRLRSLSVCFKTCESGFAGSAHSEPDMRLEKDMVDESKSAMKDGAEMLNAFPRLITFNRPRSGDRR